MSSMKAGHGVQKVHCTRGHGCWLSAFHALCQDLLVPCCFGPDETRTMQALGPLQ